MEKKKTLFLCLFLLAPASCCDEPKGVRSIRGALAGAGNPVVFSPSGEKLYSCWENGAVRIYESASGKLLRETSVPLVGTQATDWIGVSKDEARIFVGAFCQDVVVLDLRCGGRGRRHDGAAPVARAKNGRHRLTRAHL